MIKLTLGLASLHVSMTDSSCLAESLGPEKGPSVQLTPTADLIPSEVQNLAGMLEWEKKLQWLACVHVCCACKKQCATQQYWILKPILEFSSLHKCVYVCRLLLYFI